MSKGSRREREAQDLYQQAGYKDPDTLRELYWEKGLSMQEIGDELGCSMSTVHHWMEKHGIERRKSPSEKPVYYGMVGDGYEAWQSNASNERVTVYVHKLVAVAEYGFQEVVENDVHHRNGVKWDNRPENLEPLEPSEHLSMHVQEQTRDSGGEFA